MTRPTSLALGITAVVILGILGVLTFAAGGIVARHHISPLVGIVNVAEANVKSLVKSVRGEGSNDDYFISAHHYLKMTTYPTSDTGKGDNVGFAPLAEGYLIGQRAGGLKYVQLTGEGVSVQELETRIPTNKEQFLQVDREWNERLKIQFGAKDVFIDAAGDGISLYATFHYWKPEEECAVLRLARLQTTADALISGRVENDWQRVFDTQPCMLMNNTPDHAGEDNAFLQSGGRLDKLDSSHLLLTVGDHFFDSIQNDNLVQDPEASYGKILKVNVDRGTASVYSTGHRNPQGLYIDSDGEVWATEHGPRGGDELNRIEEGANYGWPYVNYGTNYTGVDWPEHLHWANHEGYTKPVFAWLPSIAVNNIIRIEDSSMPQWQGDLVVTSLRDEAIHRLILADDGHVIVNERVEIGNRVRDLMETEDGRLLLLTDDGELRLIEAVSEGGAEQALPAELQAARLWVQCSSCHSHKQGDGHGVGPNLHGVVGGDIARFEDYNYSEALREKTGEWTPEQLDAFLRDPQAFAPGTAMAFQGVKSARDRQILIDYLRKQQ